jgi:hypothetical protein
MSPSSGRRNGAPPPSPGPGLERLDQGKELALHQQITELIGTKVYSCDSHSL